MVKTTSKDVNDLIKEAERQGWAVTMTKNCHLKWSHRSGALFFSSSTPSDRRVVQNIKRDLRMHGFIEIKQKQSRKRER